jgi:hypothetical protein
VSRKAGRPNCGLYCFISFGSCSVDVTGALGTISVAENEQQDTVQHQRNTYTDRIIIITYVFKNKADARVEVTWAHYHINLILS